MALAQHEIEQKIVAIEDYKLGEKTTVVLLKLENGFEVIGKSGCVDPGDYDHEIGRAIALEKAKDKVWLVEGYLSQQQSYERGD